VGIESRIADSYMRGNAWEGPGHSKAKMGINGKLVKHEKAA
jgi:hypothetical protein